MVPVYIHLVAFTNNCTPISFMCKILIDVCSTTESKVANDKIIGTEIVSVFSSEITPICRCDSACVIIITNHIPIRINIFDTDNIHSCNRNNPVAGRVLKVAYFYIVKYGFYPCIYLINFDISFPISIFSKNSTSTKESRNKRTPNLQSLQELNEAMRGITAYFG